MKRTSYVWLLAVALVANAQSSKDPLSGLLDSLTNIPSQSSSAPTSESSTPADSSTAPPDPGSSSSPSSTPPPPSTSPPPAQSSSSSQVVTTNSNGDTITTEIFVTIPPPSSSASPSATAPPENNDDSPALSTGGIVGLAVAGGTALICFVGFLVWKFTRKRAADFDDNENIKWPELNAHGGDGNDSHAMPVTNTGRAGFSDTDSIRAPSAYAASSTDFHPEDPYAIPPLPHMNPGLGQPYRDDPNAPAAGYYDPYRGPVPQTFNEANGAPPADWGGNEAIAMTQMGRASPGPQMMYGDVRTGSPGPQAAYANMGRTPSPGPQAAYGGGRASPGPQAAYAAGRASPAPGQIYGGGV